MGLMGPYLWLVFWPCKKTHQTNRSQILIFITTKKTQTTKIPTNLKLMARTISHIIHGTGIFTYTWMVDFWWEMLGKYSIYGFVWVLQTSFRVNRVNSGRREIPGVGRSWNTFRQPHGHQSPTVPWHSQVAVPVKWSFWAVGVLVSMKNWKGPNPNGPLRKLLELLDTEVQWVLLEISWIVGNEGIKLYVVIMGWNIPHSLLRAS